MPIVIYHSHRLPTTITTKLHIKPTSYTTFPSAGISLRIPGNNQTVELGREIIVMLINYIDKDYQVYSTVFSLHVPIIAIYAITTTCFEQSLVLVRTKTN